MNRILINLVLLTGLSGFLLSCEDDPKLPDNIVEFEASVVGISEEEESLSINVNLSRETSSDAVLTFSLEPNGVTYGTDFTLTPPPVANIITVTILEGETQATITLTKTPGVLFDGDESVTLTLTSAAGKLVVGETNQIVVNFSEIIIGQSTMDIQGGGPTYPNKVFIDLSANRQTAIERTTWDFGFSSGADFRVILNSSNGMMARQLDKNDLTTVTAADTVGFGAQQTISAVFAAITSDPVPDWAAGSIAWIDDPSGNINATAIAEISATAAENKVYIINRGDGPGTPATKLGWKKIRVIRNGTGYTLQHADIASAVFSEIQITKNTSHAFQYVSLATGSVSVEPETDKWDIAWTGFTNSTMSGVGPVPYYFQDVVLQNTAGVQAVQILTSVKTYDAFAESDIATLDFGTQTQLKIGTNWRSGGGPSGPPALRTDRFYVIKDADNNYYKLKFTALTQNGERGRPAIEFALLQ